MDIHLSLRHGPLKIEIDADREEDYQQELGEILEFIQEYEDRLEELQIDTSAEDVDGDAQRPSDGQVSMDQFAESADSSNQNSSATNPVDAEVLGSLPKKVDASPKAIREIVDIDPDGEEPPFLLVNTDEFGDTKKRRQFVTSLLILAIWDECYEADRMKSSLLKDSLEHSGVDSSSMSNMYDLENADSFFHKQGRGASTTLKLRRPGKREAYKQLRELVEYQQL